MKLPVVSGADAVKAFQKAGYQFDGQHGSHIILRRIHRIGGCRFPTTRNSLKVLYGP